MLERAVEDWLTSATERYYQLPFAQVLMNQGHEILYLSRHGQGEHGKDIITLSPEGEYHAYQLKRGDIALGDWRGIEGEIRDLVNLPIVHPLVDKGEIHKSFLVTNGLVNTPVREQIDRLNENALAHGYPEVGLFQRPQLLGYFMEAAGAFMPADIGDLGQFLDIMRSDGSDFLDKEALFGFLHTTFFDAEAGGRDSDKSHAVKSSAVVLAYLLAPQQRAENHYAVFEAWVVLASTVLSFASRFDLKKPLWEPTFHLACDEAADALRVLRDEMLERADYLEGDSMGDGGEIHKARALVCLGAAACSLRVDAEVGANDEFVEVHEGVTARIAAEYDSLRYPGDAAFPHVLAIAVALDSAGLPDEARSLVERHLRGIVEICLPSSGLGIPSPYYPLGRVALSAQRMTSRLLGLVREVDEDLDIDLEQFSGASWVLEPLVQMAARRGMRDLVGDCWRDISHIQYTEFRPESEQDALLFHCEHGDTASWFPNAEQSWQTLCEEASLDDAPWWVNTYPTFARMFPLVYPHRVTSRLARALDTTSDRQGTSVSAGTSSMTG